MAPGIIEYKVFGNKKGDREVENHLISRAELLIQIINVYIYFQHKPFHFSLRNINLPEWEIKPTRQETYIDNIIYRVWFTDISGLLKTLTNHLYSLSFESHFEL